MGLPSQLPATASRIPFPDTQPAPAGSAPSVTAAGSGTRSYAAVFYITSAFLFTATFLRSVLTLAGNEVRVRTLVLLVVWLVLFLAEEVVSGRARWLFAPYLLLQTAIVFALLSQSASSDFFAVLWAVLSMQLVQRWPLRLAGAFIALFVPLTALGIGRSYDPVSTVVSSLTYGAVAGITAFYAWSAGKARKESARAESLACQLREANLDLQSHSERIARLSVARERNRIARELHDSVTQTIFAMTLAARSLVLLDPDDRLRVDGQLDRLTALANSALAEMRVLVSQLRPQMAKSGLVKALQEHLANRVMSDGLSVALEVEGEGELTSTEEQGLFRIAQEALNNVAKHAGTSEATLRLRLDEAPEMEICDCGRGFDLNAANDESGIGLSTMRERAAEIGWTLEIATAPSEGTTVRMERSAHGT